MTESIFWDTYDLQATIMSGSTLSLGEDIEKHNEIMSKALAPSPERTSENTVRSEDVRDTSPLPLELHKVTSTSPALPGL